MFWIPFYKILQKTRGRLNLADPKELEYAAKENTERSESPTQAFRTAYEEYVKDPNLEL